MIPIIEIGQHDIFSRAGSHLTMIQIVNKVKRARLLGKRNPYRCSATGTGLVGLELLVATVEVEPMPRQ